MMSRYRPRKEVKMWLYTDKPDEEKLVGYVTYLKQTRKLAQAIRNGLRLLWSLGEGDTTVLFELFPHLEAQLASHFVPPTPPDSGDMQRQIEAAVRAGIEKAMQNLPALPAGRMVAEPAYKEVGGSISASAGIGSTLGTGKLMALPTFDDDDDMPTLVLSKSTKATSNGANLMSSMFSLEQ